MRERDRQALRCLTEWSGFSVGMIISDYIPKQTSKLSDILQTDVPEKYYLSAKACIGILRRAEKRGKKLPEVLEMALRQQAAIGTGGARMGQAEERR